MTSGHSQPGSPAADRAPEQGLAFATTLAARLCHDLAGTMGALSGMLDMAVEGREPEALDMALTCARELSGKLRLLRAAWGMEGDAPDLASVVAGLPGAERLRVALPPQAAMDEGGRRLAANLLLVAAGGLPRGGAIRLGVADAEMSLEIEGPRAAWPAALSQCLADPNALRAACTTSRDVSVAMACLIAGQVGWRLTVQSPTRLTAGP